MGDSLMTVIAIFLAVILMFLFPMLAVAERTDDISQLSVGTSVTTFVDDCRSVGKITMDSYQELISAISATGNTYDVELEVKSIDENVGKKTAWTTGTVIGENVYYSVFTSQILDQLTTEGVYKMKEGDLISCKVKNTNTTISQTLRSVFYSISSNSSYQVGAQHSGIVTASGK